MGSDQQFEKYLDNIIFKKRWADIRGAWLNYAAKISYAGELPRERIEDILPLRRICDQLEQEENKFLLEDADYVRPIVLSNAIFTLDKAANVISNAQNDVIYGYKTWSIVNAYHGAFFAAKSIISIFGISICGLQTSLDKPFLTLIDCWPHFIQPKEKKKQLNLGSDEEVLFSKPNLNKIEQRHFWLLLQRVLKVMTIEDTTWSRSYIKILNSIDFKSFGKQRNYLFYNDNSWLFDDLHEFLYGEDFGLYNDSFVDNFRTKEKDKFSDFSLCISLLLLKMSFTLFTELSDSTKLLEDRFNLLNSCLSSDKKHPLYLNSTFD